MERTRTAALAASLLALVVLPAVAALASQHIGSPGPLTDIWVGDELSCQVHHQADAIDHQFYPPAAPLADCGTFLAAGGVLYGPDFDSHAGSAVGAFVTPFTALFQSGVGGTGTAANPYTVVTGVAAGGSGLLIEQVDTYVTGSDEFRTVVRITNTASVAQPVVLYRAGDCYHGASDFGFGAVGITAPGSVACTRTPNNAPANRYEEFVPVTPGSSYYESTYSNLWSWINGKTPFPNTCDCTTLEDNGAGLSWDLFVPAGGSVSVESRLRFGVPEPQRAHVTIHRFPTGVVLLAAPTTLGWTCNDINNNAPVGVGSALSLPDPGVSCLPPAGASQDCTSVNAGGYHAAAGGGTLDVTSACVGLSVTQSLSLPFSDPGFSTSLAGSGTMPWDCFTDESGLVIPPNPDYWVFCDVNLP
jgi:hypothetical protein